jgi:4-amino-4-deoxy-L-arabinose transferase-like glycosyltransferase
VEFFLLARLVIVDMTLTLFLTLALGAFYLASHSDNLNQRRLLCSVLYLSLGAATLIKGLIGVALPGMVIVAYLLLSKRWSVLRRIYLAPGALLFLAIVLPWYLQIGARHEGYLHYFFWQEHFGRFTMDRFDRAAPWYYFILVGAIGLFPWTLLLPFLLSGLRRRAWDDQSLFLTCWAILPFVFFSISKAKLPHYILPIFPPLALLIGIQLVRLLDQSMHRAQQALSLVWIAYSLGVLYFVTGYWLPAVLPPAIVRGVTSMPGWLWVYGVMLLALPVILRLSKLAPPKPANIFILQALILAAYLIFTTQLMITVSSIRSAKPLAEAVRSLLNAESQVVIYDTYSAGLSFYLRSERPLWVVTQDKRKRNFLGNYYLLGGHSLPTTGWGKALFDFKEFAEQWRAARQPLLVLTKIKSRAQLEAQIGMATKVLASSGRYVWLTQP